MSNEVLTTSIIEKAEYFYDAMSKFADYSKEALFKNPEAIDFCNSRLIDEGTIQEFGVGYVPWDVSEFVKFTDRHIIDYLISLGVLYVYNNSINSILGGRVIFPIYNLKGDIISFSGRVLSKDHISLENPKYIHTKNNYVFNKSLSLYGLFQALESIIQNDYCIIVEGNIDVITLSKNGIRNVVSPCGTSLTSQQLLILRRICDNIILWFDNDEAGEKAKERSVNMAGEVGFNIGAMPEYKWKDPDEILKNVEASVIIKDIKRSLI